MENDPEPKAPRQEGYDTWCAGHKAYWDAEPGQREFDDVKYGQDANPYVLGTPEREQWESGWADALEDFIAYDFTD